MKLTDLYKDVCHAYVFALSKYRSFCRDYRLNHCVSSDVVDELNEFIAYYSFLLGLYRSQGGKRTFHFNFVDILPSSVRLDDDGFVVLQF